MNGTELRLPQLAEGMEYGRLAVWLKREGDRVAAGDPIAEVETDKTTVELDAPASGVLQKIEVAAGTDAVKVGALLAIIDSGAGRADAPADRTPPRDADVSPEAARGTGVPATARLERASAFAPSASDLRRAFAIDATPLAAGMARAAGVDLATLEPGGVRVTKAAVDRALGRTASSRAAPVLPGEPGVGATGFAPAGMPAGAPARGDFSDQPLTAARRVTAARLQTAKQTIPHFYMSADCLVSDLVQLRARANADGRTKLTVTDFVVFAAARALQRVPQANASWAGDAIRLHHGVDVAVAVETPQGLITPVLRGCERKTLGAISAELKALSARARAGRLNPEEYTGGTFTVSNLGMFGVTAIVPIINPPQSCILGTGAIEERPWAQDGRVAVGWVMTCTLAADHRVLDGADAARLLAAFRELIERPMAFALHV